MRRPRDIGGRGCIKNRNPEGWKGPAVVAATAIREPETPFSATGMCEGGIVRMQDGARDAALRRKLNFEGWWSGFI